MNKQTIKKYKITCPECEAAIIVASPEAVIWERCPSCRLHVWDMDDALMADAVQEGTRFAAPRPGLGIQ